MTEAPPDHMTVVVGSREEFRRIAEIRYERDAFGRGFGSLSALPERVPVTDAGEEIVYVMGDSRPHIVRVRSC